MASDEGDRAAPERPEGGQRRGGRSARGRRGPSRRRRISARIIAGAVLAPFALLTLLAGIAAVVGGGFGPKRLGPSDVLHGGDMLLIAHRGVRREHPENSRAALRAAREQGFEAVEIDVKRSADGHFYLFHDRESRRLLGVDIDLGQQRLDELQRYPLHHEGRLTAQRILSLEAFGAEFGDDFIVYLDVKRHGDDDLRRRIEGIATFIERHDLGKRAIVGGDFLFTVLFEYRFPELYTSLGGPGDFRARAYRWIPQRFRPDFMVARADELTPGLVRWLRERGLIDRWIVMDVDAGNRAGVERWGFSKLLLD